MTFKKLVLTVAPVTVLALVLAAGLRIVRSDPAVGLPGERYSQQSGDQQTRVTTQSVVIEANSSVTAKTRVKEAPQKLGVQIADDAQKNQLDEKEVWAEINDAISGLNKLVGAEMFREVKRLEKGQLQVVLDKTYWDRVSYITRVDLKNDISNLWHLYVKEYSYFDSSVVYFVNKDNGKVIDIFSKAS